MLIFLLPPEGQSQGARQQYKALPTVPPDPSATPGSLPAGDFNASVGLGNSQTHTLNPLQRDLVTVEIENELRAKHFDKVIDLCDAALKAWTARPGLLLRLRGQAYAGKGKLRPALDDYEEAIKYQRDFPWVYLERGLIYQAGKRWNSAVRDFQKAIELGEQRPPDRDFANFLNDLAWLRATCPEPEVRDGKAALSLAKRACALSEWEEANFVDTLAAAYAETGEFSKAAAFQEGAMWMTGVTAEGRAGMEQRLNLYREHKPFRE